MKKRKNKLDREKNSCFTHIILVEWTIYFKEIYQDEKITSDDIYEYISHLYTLLKKAPTSDLALRQLIKDKIEIANEAYDEIEYADEDDDIENIKQVFLKRIEVDEAAINEIVNRLNLIY